jgi:hypothetical protein
MTGCSFHPNRYQYQVSFTKYVEQLGITINKEKSVLQPTTTMVYLRLNIDSSTSILQPTTTCIKHLMELASVIPRALTQDLHRIAGYLSWITYAIGWPFS